MGDNSLFDLIAGTVANDRKVNAESVGKSASEGLTFKRDEKGVLWSYDVKTGKRVGRIFEHGDDSKIDTIKEI